MLPSDERTPMINRFITALLPCYCSMVAVVVRQTSRNRPEINPTQLTLQPN